MSTDQNTRNDLEDQQSEDQPQDTDAQTTTEPEPDDQDQPQEAADDAQEGPETDDGSPLAKARAESAQRRVALREAQEQNKTLSQQVTALQDAALAAALDSYGVTLEAVKAAGHRDAAFAEDGTVNPDALQQIANDTASRFGTTRRRLPQPDPHAGQEIPPGGPSYGSGWQQKLRGGN